MTQSADQVRIRLISQLIKVILPVPQKWFKDFNDTALFSFIIPALLVLSNNLDLNLSYSE